MKKNTLFYCIFITALVTINTWMFCAFKDIPSKASFAIASASGVLTFLAYSQYQKYRAKKKANIKIKSGQFSK